MDSRLPMGFGAIEDPTTIIERTELAKMCTETLGLSIPTVVDDMDDAVSRAYHGWPERLYLIDQAGNVAYRGGPGPFGFDPDGFEEAIRAHLEGPPTGPR